MLPALVIKVKKTLIKGWKFVVIKPVFPLAFVKIGDVGLVMNALRGGGGGCLQIDIKLLAQNKNP